jgi:hypothetical protein
LSMPVNFMACSFSTVGLFSIGVAPFCLCYEI